MDVRRYRKKPVAIQAVQIDPDNVTDVLDWITENGGEALIGARRVNGSLGLDKGDSILIHTLEGDHWAEQGDWVLCGVAGEFYPCKPEIFASTYEGPVDDNGVAQPRGEMGC